MGYVMKQNIAHSSNYSRAKYKKEYIVVHYTGNDFDTDEANTNYFKGANRNASAHVFVDDDSATISVPFDMTAWSVGRNYGGKLFNVAKNSNTLNVEMCDRTKDGAYSATEATMNNAAALIKKLMLEYGIPMERVVRHYDVCNKRCPAYMVDESAWLSFKKRIEDSKPGVIIPGEVFDLENGNASENVPSTPFSQSRKITASSLNVRKGPGINYDIITRYPKGKVVEVVGKAANGWFETKDGFMSGSDSYSVEVPKEPEVEKPVLASAADLRVITASSLNVRTGTNTDHSIVGVYRKGTLVPVKAKADNGWFKTDKGFMSGSDKYSYSAYGLIVNCNSLNFRTSAGVAPNNLAFSLNSGTKINLLDRAPNGWFYAQAQDGRRGWCSDKYVKITR